MKRGVLLAGLGLTLFACGSSGTSTSSSSSSSSGGGAQSSATTASCSGRGGGHTVGLLLSGPANDQGYYQAAKEGLDQVVKDCGVKPLVADNVDPAAGVQAVRNLVSQGADIIIGAGEEFEDSEVQVASSTPNVKFIVENGKKPSANVADYKLKEGESAYLAGAAAGVLGDKTVGFVGGIEIPSLIETRTDFGAGLTSIVSDAKYINQITGDFNDSNLAKEAVLSQVRQGANLILPYLGAGVVGAVQAITEQKVKAVSPSVDRCGQDGFWALSDVASPHGLVYRAAVDTLTGHFEPTKAKFFGLETPDVGRVVLCSAPPSGVQQKLDQIKQGLINGSIKLPYEA